MFKFLCENCWMITLVKFFSPNQIYDYFFVRNFSFEKNLCNKDKGRKSAVWENQCSRSALFNGSKTQYASYKYAKVLYFLGGLSYSFDRRFVYFVYLCVIGIIPHMKSTFIFVLYFHELVPYKSFQDEWTSTCV